jgi:valyl-tRNA synthetase
MVKYRLYEGGDESAKYTLYTSLLTLLKLFAPIIPHITEELYQIYFRKTEKDVSIHTSKWPDFDGKMVDEKAEEIGELAKQIISALRQFKSSRKLALNTEVKTAMRKQERSSNR